MAEAFLNKLAGDRFEAESAGLKKGTLNPVVVEAMKEIGIDISKNQTKDVSGFFKKGRIYSNVITVCDEASAERCPVFPGLEKQLHWSFSDPSQFQGTHEERLAQTRRLRDEIKYKIEEFIKQEVITTPIILQSVITCPECGHKKEELMPADACRFLYECENCKTVLKPEKGDCCVFCSYGSVPCPPVQERGRSGCCT